MSKPMKYCNNCKMLYGEVAVHRNSLTCPVNTCRNHLKMINGMFDIINVLNNNKYYVIDASLENDNIYILFDRKCRFQRVPKGFNFNGVSLPSGEVAILINYSELNPNKTAEELRIIRNDIAKWVMSFCKCQNLIYENYSSVSLAPPQTEYIYLL